MLPLDLIIYIFTIIIFIVYYYVKYTSSLNAVDLWNPIVVFSLILFIIVIFWSTLAKNKNKIFDSLTVSFFLIILIIFSFFPQYTSIVLVLFWLIQWYLLLLTKKGTLIQIELDNKEIQKNERLKTKFFFEQYPHFSELLFTSKIFKFFYIKWVKFSILFLLISIIWWANIFTNLWNLPFHQDEKYHFSPAISYNSEWQFARWDFLYEEPLDFKYADRNKSLTIFTSISQNLFWVSELSSRLPVALMWFIGMFVLFFVTKNITWSNAIWLISMYIYSINDVVIYFSRFLRWYIFLMIWVIILIYLLYKTLKEKDAKNKLIYLVVSFITFIIGLEFHASIIILFPTLGVVSLIYLFQSFSFKKYLYIYIAFFAVLWFFVLNVLWIIHTIKLPYNIQNHIDLSTFKWNAIYLKHIVNPFNFWFLFLFLLPLIFFINPKKNHKLYIILFLSIFIPLFFASFFFKRYEDFRYISLIQPVFIICTSIFIYYFWKISFYWTKLSSISTILFLIIIINFQFPFVKPIQNLTQKAQANWENIEWHRLHFRTSIPENKKAFDYIFENNSKIVMLRLADWWINWDDNYYLKKYIDTYKEKEVIFYTNIEWSKNFNEIYNSNKSNKSLLNSNVDFFEILNIEKNIIIIWNVRDLTNKDIIKFLDNTCKNIAPKIGIVKYRIFEYAHPEDNYFPNVFLCDKN